MANLEELLKEVSKIVVEEKTQQEEKRKRGENFNIFKVLGLSTSEVRLHSAFLAELLKPDGDHGLGTRFLSSFLDLVIKPIEGLKEFEFDVESAKVTSEFHIGSISKDGTKGGRIDILLKDKNGHLIIIENKIDAGDQPMQLLRYYNYAINERKTDYENQYFCILYLTKEGYAPSNISLGINSEENSEPNEKALKTKVKYECISYREDIRKWLDECIRTAVLHPAIRETIQQYKINLFQILNNMEKENYEKMIEILTSSNNIDTTMVILKKASDIYKQIRKKFVYNLKAFTESVGLNLDFDEGIVNPNNDSWIRIYDDKLKGGVFRIGVYEHTNNDGFRMDFITTNKIEEGELEFKKFWDHGYEPNIGNPLGWIYLWSETSMPNSGRWWRWDDINTIEDMINGKMLDYFQKQINDIKERNIFAELNALVYK